MGELGSFSFAPVRAIIAELGSNRGDPELKLPDRSLGRFFEVTLPASEHECFHMHLVNRHAHLGSTSWTAKEPFFVPLKVAAGGGTHYLGGIRGFPLLGKSLLGFQVSDGGYIVFVAREARDTASLAKRRSAALSR